MVLWSNFNVEVSSSGPQSLAIAIPETSYEPHAVDSPACSASICMGATGWFFEQIYVHVGQLLGTNKILHVYVHILFKLLGTKVVLSLSTISSLTLLTCYCLCLVYH